LIAAFIVFFNKAANPIQPAQLAKPAHRHNLEITFPVKLF